MGDWNDIEGAHYVMTSTTDTIGVRGRVRRRLRRQRPSQVGVYALLLVVAPVCLVTAIAFLVGAFSQPYFSRGWDVFVGALFLSLGAVSIVIGIRALRAGGREKSRRGDSPTKREKRVRRR